MKPGEISDPVLTRFGWHIIKVEKVNEESTVSFEEAKPSILKKMLDEAAANLAYDAAEKVYNLAFEGDDLVNVAKEYNLDVKTTDFFTIKKGPENLINSEKFASTAFSLPLMEISDIVDIEKGYYLIQVIKKEQEKIPPIEDVKERLVADLIKEKQNKAANADAKQLLSDLKKGKLMSEEIKKFNLIPVKTGFFQRYTISEGSGLERKVVDAAFKLSSEKIFPEDVINGTNGYYVIKFLDRKKPDNEAFSDKKEEIKQAVLERKKYYTFNSWLDQLKNKSKIVIKKGFLD